MTIYFCNCIFYWFNENVSFVIIILIRHSKSLLLMYLIVTVDICAILDLNRQLSNMEMYFFQSYKTTILFKEWETHTIGGTSLQLPMHYECFCPHLVSI